MSFEIKKFKYDKILFPDGTMKLNLERTKLDDADSLLPHMINIYWKFENEGELIELMYIVKHIRDWHNDPINLHIDYLPQARMDRVYTNDEVFTLKYICEFINNLNFNEVKILDPHSDVSLALLNRVSAWYPKFQVEFLIEYDEINTIVFPDNGSYKKYTKVYSDIIKDCNIIQGYKNRDWKTGEIKGIKLLGEINPDDKVLVIDDICSKGGTFVEVAKALKSKKLMNKPILFVSHCEDTIKQGKVKNYYENVYTSNWLGDEANLPDYVNILS